MQKAYPVPLIQNHTYNSDTTIHFIVMSSLLSVKVMIHVHSVHGTANIWQHNTSSP